MPHTNPPDPAGTCPLAPREFEQIRRLAYDTCGIDLKHGKEALVSARLRKPLLKAGARSYEEYYRWVRADASGDALAEMIDALTTNHTAFLREPDHFRFLNEQLVPGWKRRGRVAIWCAACATGEEAWTLAFLLADAGLATDGCVFASDVSRRAVRFASEAAYPGERCEALPLAWKQRYFAGTEPKRMAVRPSFRRLVEFRQVNLVRPYTLGRAFPAIFCRNVMIYFDKATQEAVVGRLADHLEPGGYLFVGHAESLTGTSHPLEYVSPAIYRKPGGRR